LLEDRSRHIVAGTLRVPTATAHGVCLLHFQQPARESRTRMEVSLIVVKGKATKARIALKLPTIIGRSREVAITIAHPMVSRQHCELFEANGVLMIRDLGSLNGTVVDGRRIKEAPLPPETEFTVGPLTFRADYPYTGDLTKLPAPVLAASAAASPAAGTEEPDFEAFDESPVTLAKNETVPAPTPTPKGAKPSPAPAKATMPAKQKAPDEPAAPKKPKAEPKSESPKQPTDPDAIFDDFLNDLE
jgi:hypothetical protein